MSKLVSLAAVFVFGCVCLSEANAMDLSGAVENIKNKEKELFQSLDSGCGTIEGSSFIYWLVLLENRGNSSAEELNGYVEPYLDEIRQKYPDVFNELFSGLFKDFADAIEAGKGIVLTPELHSKMRRFYMKEPE